MLTELCQELRNWFPVRDKTGAILSYPGVYEITGGALTAPFLLTGQYYRITGSIFNDGVHRFGDINDQLVDETFEGTVWALAIPQAVIKLSTEIEAWREKYEAPDGSAMSPFMSESFGGYSYQKGSAFSGNTSGGSASWQSAFAAKLNAWRKL